MKGAFCQSDADCQGHAFLKFGHGPMTGRCVPSDRFDFRDKKVCEIESWCPVERDGLVKALPPTQPLMDRVDKYTVFIKNSIAFPLFGKQYRRNNVIPGPGPVFFHAQNNTLGQIFWLGDIVELAEGNFTELSLNGGVISISIKWRCDLDYDFMKYCLPKYEFRVLDSGWNFRHALFHENHRRTLIKVRLN